MGACIDAYGMGMPARFADMAPDEIGYDGAGFWGRAKRRVEKHKVAICAVACIALAVTGIGAGLAPASSLTLMGTAITAGIPITGYCATSIGMMSAISTGCTVAGISITVIGAP